MCSPVLTHAWMGWACATVGIMDRGPILRRPSSRLPGFVGLVDVSNALMREAPKKLKESF